MFFFLQYASRRIDDIADDTRIVSLLKGAGKSQRNVDYSTYATKGHININNLDSVSYM